MRYSVYIHDYICMYSRIYGWDTKKIFTLIYVVTIYGYVFDIVKISFNVCVSIFSRRFIQVLLSCNLCIQFYIRAYVVWKLSHKFMTFAAEENTCKSLHMLQMAQ